MWEYSVQKSDLGVDDMNKMGADGWELVAFQDRPGYQMKLIYKRPKAAPQPEPAAVPAEEHPAA